MLRGGKQTVEPARLPSSSRVADALVLPCLDTGPGQNYLSTQSVERSLLPSFWDYNLPPTTGSKLYRVPPTG